MYTCGVFIDVEKAFDTVNHNSWIIMVLEALQTHGSPHTCHPDINQWS